VEGSDLFKKETTWNTRMDKNVITIYSNQEAYSCPLGCKTSSRKQIRNFFGFNTAVDHMLEVHQDKYDMQLICTKKG
jgi:hypothetical protein